MKAGFVFMTVLAIVTMLVVGCTVPGAPSPVPTPDSSVPAPTPGPTTQPPSAGSSTGTIKVLVTDAPGYEVENVVVHFLKVEVHKAADESGGDGVWKEIPLDVPDDQTFDDTKEIELNSEMGKVILAEGQLEEGKYTSNSRDYERRRRSDSDLHRPRGNTA